MRRYIALLLVALFVTAPIERALSNNNQIAITPMVSDLVDIPDAARSALSMKLGQMATMNGFASADGEFVLTANVRYVDKQITATAPAQYIIELEVSAYVIGAVEKIVTAECSFNVRGISNNEARATIMAMNQIKPKSPVVVKFMNDAREKMLEYYAARVPALLAKSQALVDQEKYDEALSVLGTIPESLNDYPMVAEKMSQIFIQKVDKEGAVLIQEANAKIAIRDYAEALDCLTKIDPLSKHFKAATSKVNSIKATIDAEERQKYEAQMAEIARKEESALRAQDNAVMLEKMRIEASTKQAEALSRAPQNTNVSRKMNAMRKSAIDWLIGSLN